MKSNNIIGHQYGNLSDTELFAKPERYKENSATRKLDIQTTLKCTTIYLENL